MGNCLSSFGLKIKLDSLVVVLFDCCLISLVVRVVIIDAFINLFLLVFFCVSRDSFDLCIWARYRQIHHLHA